MIDVHTHFIDPTLSPPSAAAERMGWPVCERRGDRVEVRQRGRVVRIVGPEAWDVGVRLARMDQLGVERQVVMPTPFTFLYDADPAVAVELCRRQNDVLAALVEASGGRLLGLAGLPLGSPEQAVAEVSRARDQRGFPGVEIGTHAARNQLHHGALDGVFEALDARAMCVFVHPWQPVATNRTCHHGLAFGLGRAVETELAVGSLLFGGRIERHPNIRFCLAHGGAGIPAIRGRLRNGWSRQDPDNRVPVRDPLELLARLWADGLTYDAPALALAEQTFGRIVVGSDFPFAAQESFPGQTIADAVEGGLSSLGRAWREVTADSAEEFLGISRKTVPGDTAASGRTSSHTVEEGETL